MQKEQARSLLEILSNLPGEELPEVLSRLRRGELPLNGKKIVDRVTIDGDSIGVVAQEGETRTI